MTAPTDRLVKISPSVTPDQKERKESTYCTWEEIIELGIQRAEEVAKKPQIK